MFKTYLPAKGSEEKEEINENLELRERIQKKTVQKRKPLHCLYAIPKDRSLLKHAIIYHRTSLPAAL